MIAVANGCLPRTHNLMLEDAESIARFTGLRAVFNALPGACENHDWLVSDLECIWLKTEDDDGMPDERLRGGSVLIAGEDLSLIIQTRRIQFAWAVFTALPKGARPRVAPEHLPYADGNRTLWIGSPKPQCPQALFEIVCWDSTYTLLIGLNDRLAASFRIAFPTVLDLDAYNQLHGPPG